MAEGMLVTGIVQEFIGRLSSAFWTELGRVWSFEEDLDDLKSQLTTIEAVLQDAENRCTKDAHALRLWLRKLKDAAYEAEDLLDEIQTKFHKKKLHQKGRQSASNPTNPVFRWKMARRIKSLGERFNKIAEERHKFHLTPLEAPHRQMEFEKRETFSVIDETKVIGRDDDKNKIIDLLLDVESAEEDVSVIPLVGMGGLGKTTLAQLVFNDQRVKSKHFDLRAWIFVPVDFNFATIAKPILNAAKETCDLTNLESIATRLNEIIRGQRFLLVFDDVWNEDQEKWQSMKAIFKDGKKGSKILLTTRSEKVAAITKSLCSYRLKHLSEDDCWELFERRAFEKGEQDKYPMLEKIGRDIVKKCGGLPLAANALGGMMRFKRSKDEWIAVRDSEVWKLETDDTILPSLKLSYTQMSPALKRCFAYCAIFPKDHLILKHELIQQWIALGFIRPSGGSTSAQVVGNEYFNNLLWMSFLQDLERWKYHAACRMHDLVHDLAQSVAQDEVAVAKNITQCCRYASLVIRQMEDTPKTLPSNIRALILRDTRPSVPLPLCSKLKFLRVLDLQGCDIQELPESIKKLKLLRYLDLALSRIRILPRSITSLVHLQYMNLSHSNMERLPDGIGSLENLQTLDLHACPALTILPESIGNLQKLQNLDLSFCSNLETLPCPLNNFPNLETLDIACCGKIYELPEGLESLTNLIYLSNYGCFKLKSMPKGMGRLVNLQTLSEFIVGDQDSGKYCSMEELEHLNITGELTIRGLENVKNPSDANKANLREKQGLQTLKLVWTNNEEEAEAVTVLKNLLPHQNLEILYINGYIGSEFCGWMMNGIESWLPNLVEITLSDIYRCDCLPPLGQLPVLKELLIESMPEIRNVGKELCGHRYERTLFPSLTRLRLSRMSNLEEWLTAEMVNDNNGTKSPAFMFPRLEVLEIDDCPKLRVEPCLPPSLLELTVRKLDEQQLSLILERVNRTSFPPSSLPCHVSALSDGWKGLQRLYIHSCSMNCLPESLGNLTSLHSLQIHYCHNLATVPEWIGELTSLQSLKIENCQKLDYLPVKRLTSLEDLSIWGCQPIFLDLYRAGSRNTSEAWFDVSHIRSVNIKQRIVRICRIILRTMNPLYLPSRHVKMKVRLINSIYLLPPCEDEGEVAIPPIVSDLHLGDNSRRLQRYKTCTETKILANKIVDSNSDMNAEAS